MTVTTRRQEARRNSELDNPELDDTSEPGNIVLANPPEDLLETVINTWGQRASTVRNAAHRLSEHHLRHP